MPRRTEPMLADHLFDAYRAFVVEVFDTIAAAGYADLPQSATAVFRHLDARGSFLADLAAQGGYTLEVMRLVVRDLEAGGYVEVDDDIVRPARRGEEAFAVSRHALELVEDRWQRRLGPERFRVFRDVVREMGAGGPFT